ncbi:hypothetical protein NQ176_g5035 [Zarea fungicola]|uniref:Uncharacterized protein n=1 Tax=Zarea fungicola TaxID=93591 RepID=A0ACC1NBF7_9HYPO|nr:hypothetical protein NQ176_g5035 [Lecanicillium fungicola]
MPESQDEHPARNTKLAHGLSRALWKPLTVTLPPPIFLLSFLLLGFCFLLFPIQNKENNSISPLISESQLPSLHTTFPKLPTDSSPNMSNEQTFIAIKPDGVQRGLVGPIVSRFENRGFKLVAIKLVSPSKDHLESHYADLKGKPFFDGLIQYMLSGPICAMVWEGRDAVKTGRTILGATNPLASAPGTIRGDFAIDVGRNVCHGSDSVENAKKEIALWFEPKDLINWTSAQFNWIYEKA